MWWVLANFYQFLFGAHTIKDHFQEHIPSESDLHDFALWAFGEGYESKTSIQLMNLWNNKHSSIYSLKPYITIEKDALRMVNLWRNSI